ncbi:N-acetyltransferase [Robiginitomaculum antarcticum]|uniref:N-acetyltransferase n=1 Tax=Robiginitomaculum antarcticum TaxID=437507 RepID=UPI00037BCBDD|nr:acyltransferase [Robiginitomaculum antarcticum]
MSRIAESANISDSASVHETCYVDADAKIGADTKIWHFSHILPRTKIGSGCSIGQNVSAGPDVSIGNGCKIQNNVSLYTGVELEDGVFCGPSMVFTNVTTPRADVNRRSEYAKTIVRKGATIGANATIVCGNEVGGYCLIAAGAVVVKAVKAHALMAGVPAKRIGWVSHAGEVLRPDDAGRMICPRTGDEYQETDGNLVLRESQST